MTTSNIIAVIMLIIAIADSLLVRYVLPGMLDKNPNTTPEQKKVALTAISSKAFVFAAFAMIIYFTQYAG